MNYKQHQKKHMKYLLLVLALIINSCVITNTPGFYNGYKKLSDHEKEQVIFLDDSSEIGDLNNRRQIVAINGRQLLTFAKGIDSLLIYTWGPDCSSESCILVAACQKYCNARNYKLAVVAEYYNMQAMNAQNVADLPVLIANHTYYNKYYAISLNKAFMKDLLKESDQ